MNAGQVISGAGHLGLISWMLIGRVFSPAPDPVEVTEVAMISGAEYTALLAAQDAPAVADQLDQPQQPETQADALIPSENEDQPLEVTPPDVAQTTPPDNAPDVTQLLTLPDTDVVDEVPEINPPAEDPEVVTLPKTSLRPKARPAQRVAPEPVAQPEPDVKIDNTAQDSTKPADLADQQKPKIEETAPEEATTKTVTEADEKADETAAPQQSVRPKTRPKALAQKPPKADKPAVSGDAINDALKQALGGGTSDAPSGPPMTRGEKDALRVGVSKCWNVGALSSDAMRVTVTVNVAMNQDATPVISSIKQVSQTGGTVAAAKQAFEAARRAIIRCGAKGYDLPQDKYGQWRNIEMTFNPDGMRIK